MKDCRLSRGLTCEPEPCMRWSRGRPWLRPGWSVKRRAACGHTGRLPPRTPRSPRTPWLWWTRGLLPGPHTHTHTEYICCGCILSESINAVDPVDSDWPPLVLVAFVVSDLYCGHSFSNSFHHSGYVCARCVRQGGLTGVRPCPDVRFHRVHSAGMHTDQHLQRRETPWPEQ